MRIPTLEGFRQAIASANPRAAFHGLLATLVKAGAPARVSAHSPYETSPVEWAFRLPADPVIRFSHQPFPRFILVLSGSYRLIREIGRREEDDVVEQGELRWIPPNVWNAVRNDSPRMVLSIIFYPDYVRFLWYHHYIDGGRQTHTTLHYHTHTAAGPELRAQVACMEAAAHPGEGNALMLRPTAQALLAWALHALRHDPPEEIAPGRRMVEALEAYIIEHLHEELTRDAVAQAFQISADHLTRLFRMHAGVGFVVFVRAERLKRAERLLAIPRLSVKEVATACGFSRSAYFIQCFRAEHGLSPARWRKRRAFSEGDAAG